MKKDPLREIREFAHQYKIKPDEEYVVSQRKELPLSSKEIEDLEGSPLKTPKDFDEIIGGLNGKPLKHGVIIHILQVRRPAWWIKVWAPGGRNIPRLHLVKCRTITEMENEGRFNTRYIVTMRHKDFLLQAYDGKAVRTNLYVCLNCLRSEFIRRNFEYFEPWEFPIKEFLERFSYTGVLPPTEEGKSPPPIREGQAMERCKKEKKWTCEQCRIVLEERRYLLHCHHKNGMWWDNRPSNLEALCLECHIDEHPGNHLLESRHGEREELEKFRKQQDSPPLAL